MNDDTVIKMARNGAQRAAYRAASGRPFSFGSAHSAAKQVLRMAEEMIAEYVDFEADAWGEAPVPHRFQVALEDAKFAVDTYAAMPQNLTHGL